MIRHLALVVALGACSVKTPGTILDDAPDTASTTAAARPFEYPRGSYTGWPAYSGPVPQRLLDDKGLVGIAIVADWSEVEATGDNDFDFATFADRIREVEGAHKKVVIGIIASAAKAPQWLYDDPRVEKIQIEDPNGNHNNGLITVAMFWDPIFHAQKQEMIRAFGRRFSDDPNVVGVMQNFANYYTNDWGIPVEMKDHGYTYATMMQVGRDILTTTATAFPHQAIKLPIGTNRDDMDPNKTTTQMAEDIIAWALRQSWQSRFFAQKNLMRAVSPYSDDPSLEIPNTNDYLLGVLRDIAPHAGFQMLCAASSGPDDGCRLAGRTPCNNIPGVLAKAIDVTLSYEPMYLEFWTADPLNTDPDLTDQLVAANTAMQAF